MAYLGGAFFLYEFSKVPADPLLTPDHIKPEWYFLAPYQVLKLLPSETLGLLTLLAISLVVVFLPAMDRHGPRNPIKRPVHTAVVAGGIIAFAVLTFWGWLS
jgi:ubiquinol-cytochrome c reductase cytochrome b subunit